MVLIGDRENFLGRANIYTGVTTSDMSIEPSYGNREVHSCPCNGWMDASTEACATFSHVLAEEKECTVLEMREVVTSDFELVTSGLSENTP